MKQTIKDFYSLTKPGLVYGNLLSGAAGFLVASKSEINFGLLIETLLGISLVIASACVLNNYLDQDIDRLMDRTKNRALVSGKIKEINALYFLIFLGVAGFSILYIFTNTLVVWTGIIGYLDYIIFYGMLAKRKSIYGTLVGSISGATPILAGYLAFTNKFDLGALLIFLIMVFWQMPHFYSIGVYRLEDYKKAHIPILPVKKGVHTTKLHIIFYILGFITLCLFLTLSGYTRFTFLFVMLILGLFWLKQARSGLTTRDNVDWGKKTFRFSLLTLLALSLLLSLSFYLP